MEDRDILLTSAQVAVTFAGFASLVSVFGGRATRDGAHIDGNRLRTMMLSSLLVGALSLVPFVPLRYGVGEEEGWRIASGVMLLGVVWLAWRALRDTRVARDAGIRIGRGIFWLNGLLLLVPLALSAYNAAGWSDDAAPANYLLALLDLLVLAGIQFARLIESLVLAPPGE